MKLAIFGGTFNPVHWGHLLTAEAALDQVNLDRIFWLPTYRPPYKSADILDFAQRLEMVKQAIAPHPQFSLSTVEQSRARTSYAIDALLDLQRLYPNSDWYWIAGLDSFQSLPHWHRHQDLAARCEWLVAPRAADQLMSAIPDPSILSCSQQDSAMTIDRCRQVAAQLAAESVVVRWQVLQMPLVDISSSLVRQYCRTGRSIRYLVPEAVRTYILEHALYR